MAKLHHPARRELIAHSHPHPHIHTPAPAPTPPCCCSKYPPSMRQPGEATQEAIYQELGLPVVRNTLAGYNCSVFAYGQTGAWACVGVCGCVGM